MVNHPNRGHREPPRAAVLAAVLARALPDATPHRIGLAVGAMIHAAKAHRRWGEQCCNYPMTEAQQARGDRRCERLANAADRAVNDCYNGGESGPSVTLKFGGDPRGCCGSLIVSGMPGDGWGDGYAIHD